jgi:ribosomal-protein-alanine N-acetyltransferase
MRRTRAPEQIETERLILRRPTARDVAAIFETYASDPEVTRWVGWPRHAKRGETRAFLAFSNAEWRRWPAGPYVALRRDTRALIGSTGLMFETPQRAATGYVFAANAWGHGYATEALQAMVRVARDCGVVRLYALCHHLHRASARVLEKGGFTLEGTLRRYAEFPNLQPGIPNDVLCYSIVFENLPGTEGKMRS